jgi:epidermal growth factor receptor substrate 15
MHLISSKLAGKELPASLPQSLIPPSLRSHDAPAQPQQSSAAKDLFDLFDDPPTQPPLASAPAAAFLPQPPSRRGTTQEPATRRLEPTSTGQGTAGLFPSLGCADNRLCVDVLEAFSLR